jgi:hypothetical protein
MIRIMRTISTVLMAVGVTASLGMQAQTPATAGSAPSKVTKPAQKTAVSAKVYLTPTCGCCSKWADHMKAAGFDMEREVTAELERVEPRQRVPRQLRSCHTAVIGKYLVEGHVPADVVQKLLKESPAIVGIAVPNMPIGSPGMEGPNAQPYSIVAFKADGSVYEFAKR